MILLQQGQVALRTSSTVWGGIPQLSTTFSLECGEWAPDSARVWRRWAGWRGTGLPKPSRETNFSGANADREKFILPVQLNTCRMGNLTRLIYTLALCVTIHNVGDKPTVILYTTFIAIVVSHIQRIDRQPEKTTLHSGQSCSSCMVCWTGKCIQ